VRISNLSALKVGDPARWFALVAGELVAARGRLAGAVQGLAGAGWETTLTTLARWVDDDPRLQRIRPEVPRGWNAWTPEQQKRVRALRRRKRGPRKAQKEA
jgi:hypothetical protein